MRGRAAPTAAKTELEAQLWALQQHIEKRTLSPETTSALLPAVAQRRRSRTGPSSSSNAASLLSPKLPLNGSPKKRRGKRAKSKPALPRQARRAKRRPSSAMLPLPSPSSTAAQSRDVTRGEKAIRVINSGYLRRTRPDLFLRRFVRLHYTLRKRAALAIWHRRARAVSAAERAQRALEARRLRAAAKVAAVLARRTRRKLRRAVRLWRRRAAVLRELQNKRMLELRRLDQGRGAHKIDSDKTREERKAELRRYHAIQQGTLVLQRQARLFLQRLPLIRRKRACRIVSRAWRGAKARRRVTALRRQRAATPIQTRWRVVIPRRCLRIAVRLVVQLQSHVRGRRDGARADFVEIKAATELLQNAQRCAVARTVYNALAYLHRNFTDPTITIQRFQRGIAQRRVYRRLLPVHRERVAAKRADVARRRKRKEGARLFRTARRINGEHRVVTMKRAGYNKIMIEAFTPHSKEVHECIISHAVLRKHLRCLGVAQGFDTTPKALALFVTRLRVQRHCLAVTRPGSTLPSIDGGVRMLRQLERIRTALPLDAPGGGRRSPLRADAAELERDARSAVAATNDIFILTLSNFYGDLHITVYQPTRGDGGRTRVRAAQLRKARLALLGAAERPPGVSAVDDLRAWLVPNLVVLEREQCHAAAARRAAALSVGNLVVLLAVEAQVAGFASDVQRVWRGDRVRRLVVHPRARRVVQMQWCEAESRLLFINTRTGTQWSEASRPGHLLGPVPALRRAPAWSDRAWESVEEVAGLVGPYWRRGGSSQVSTLLPSQAATMLQTQWRRKNGAVDFVLTLPQIAHALAFHERRAAIVGAGTGAQQPHRKKGRLATLTNKAIGLFTLNHDMRGADKAFAAALEAAAGSNPPVLLFGFALFTLADNRFPEAASVRRAHEALAAARYADAGRGTFERAELFFFKWPLFAAAEAVEREGESGAAAQRREEEANRRRAASLRNFALLAHHVYRDLGRAEKYFMRALQHDPEDASSKANFERLIAERKWARAGGR
jgi:hypothetical protein